MEVIFGLLVLMGMVTFRIFVRYYEELQAEGQTSNSKSDPVDPPSQTSKQEETAPDKEALRAQDRDRLKRERVASSVQTSPDQKSPKDHKQSSKHRQQAARQGMKWSQILDRPKGW